MLILKRFSSLEEQREFARRDYEGLNEAGKEALRQRRNAYAEQLKTNYRNTMKGIDNVVKPDTVTLKSNLETVGGGVRTTVNARTRRGFNDSVENFTKLHKNTTTNEMLKGSAAAKDIMRKETLANKSYLAPTKDQVKKAMERVAKPNTAVSQPIAEVAKDSINSVKNIPAGAAAKKSSKLLKRAGIGALAVGGAAGLAYGAKKLYDKKKRDNNPQQ